MLKKMTISNFKAWHEAEIEFGRITGIFGANSAGKSSLLQLLLLLKQTKNATDRGLVLDFGGSSDLVNLGTFSNVVHRHESDKRMSWRLFWKLPEKLKIDMHKGTPNRIRIEGDTLETSCEVGLSRSRLRTYRIAYKFNDVEYWVESQEGSEKNFKLDKDHSNFNFIRNRGRTRPLRSPIKTHLFPDEIRYFYQNADFLDDFEYEYEDLMDSIYYLGPLREYPRREYHWAGSSPDDVGQRGERTVDAILAATRDREMRSLGHRKRKKKFQEMIAYWLRELGLINEFRLEEIANGTNLYQTIVKTSGSSTSTALTDVGFGVSQVLPVLVLLYYVPEGSTILLEQPEIHLHPAVQSGLADVMLNVAKARKVQIIVESHSEHILRRLQRRVAEEITPPEDVALYFVSASGDKAKASNLSLNQWGEIENWPVNFFGNEMGEFAAIAKAALSRKIEQS
ncbi:MAG: DUF3696 domain-containing protein [Gammaproteobacteria bacterium]|nr:DUF3696 domain-containing protein [Gammaproteobacteria bacterium]